MPAFTRAGIFFVATARIVGVSAHTISMTDTTSRKRQPRGTTTGGQFATEAKSDAAVTLVSSPSSSAKWDKLSDTLSIKNEEHFNNAMRLVADIAYDGISQRARSADDLELHAFANERTPRFLSYGFLSVSDVSDGEEYTGHEDQRDDYAAEDMSEDDINDLSDIISTIDIQQFTGDEGVQEVDGEYIILLNEHTPSVGAYAGERHPTRQAMVADYEKSLKGITALRRKAHIAGMAKIGEVLSNAGYDGAVTFKAVDSTTRMTVTSKAGLPELSESDREIFDQALVMIDADQFNKPTFKNGMVTRAWGTKIVQEARTSVDELVALSK